MELLDYFDAILIGIAMLKLIKGYLRFPTLSKWLIEDVNTISFLI